MPPQTLLCLLLHGLANVWLLVPRHGHAASVYKLEFRRLVLCETVPSTSYANYTLYWKPACCSTSCLSCLGSSASFSQNHWLSYSTQRNHYLKSTGFQKQLLSSIWPHSYSIHFSNHLHICSLLYSKFELDSKPNYHRFPLKFLSNFGICTRLDRSQKFRRSSLRQIRFLGYFHNMPTRLINSYFRKHVL